MKRIENFLDWLITRPWFYVAFFFLNPFIRVKIKTKGDILIPKIFNNYGAEVDLSYVSPKDEIEAVLILDELKFFKEKFTPEWSLGQLKVFKKKNKSVIIPEQYLLADDNDLRVHYS